jgi:hypothetical protein
MSLYCLGLQYTIIAFTLLRITFDYNKMHLISRDRCVEIRRYLHFNDYMPYRNVEDRDRLFTIRPLFESLVSKCKDIPLRGQMFCVDQQIVPFKGQSGLKTYNPKKPHKWGYKICVL